MLTIRYAWQRRNENRRYWPSVAEEMQIFGKTLQRYDKGVGFWAKTLCWQKYIFLCKNKFVEKKEKHKKLIFL